MAKMSRMSKYKDLREGIKTEVVPNTQTTNETVKELNSLSDNDFIRDFPKIEDEEVMQPTTLVNPNQEDTFIEAVTFDKLNAQVDEELQRALSRVRQDAGHDDFNTRMDILNRIRQSQLDIKPTESTENHESIEPMLVADETNEEVVDESQFGLFKTSTSTSISESFEDEEDDEDEEEMDTKKHRFAFFKKNDDDEEDDDEQVEEIDEDEYDDDDDDDEEVEHSKFVKILNGIIVVLVLILIGLLGYFAKEFFL